MTAEAVPMAISYYVCPNSLECAQVVPDRVMARRESERERCTSQWKSFARQKLVMLTCLKQKQMHQKWFLRLVSSSQLRRQASKNMQCSSSPLQVAISSK